MLGLFLFMFSWLVLHPAARAEQNLFALTKLQISIPQYSGLDGTSFGETGSATALELQIEMDGYIFIPFTKARAVYMSGSQGFQDSGAIRRSNFTYMQGGLDLGFHFYPIRRRKVGFNIYTGASLGMAYHSIQLDESLTTTSIPKSDQSMGTGYAGILGAEFILGREAKSKWTLVAELSQRFETTKLLNNSSFNLNNMCLTLGIGW